MTPLKEGDKAPYFEGINQDGEKITLDDFKGKKLILYFYPKDNTSGDVYKRQVPLLPVLNGSCRPSGDLLPLPPEILTINF